MLYEVITSSGFYFDTFKGLLLTEAELYGEGKKISRKKPAQGKVIKAFSELSVGDYVVLGRSCQI